MNFSAAGPTVSASILLGLGAMLLVLAWATRRAHQRTRRRLEPGTALAQAESLRQNNRIKDARALLQATALKHRDESAVHYRLACCHCQLGDFRAALACLRRACDIDANWAVSAMHDPDLKELWRTGAPGNLRPSPLVDVRSPESSRAA